MADPGNSSGPSPTDIELERFLASLTNEQMARMGSMLQSAQQQARLSLVPPAPSVASDAAARSLCSRPKRSYSRSGLSRASANGEDLDAATSPPARRHRTSEQISSSSCQGVRQKRIPSDQTPTSQQQQQTSSQASTPQGIPSQETLEATRDHSHHLALPQGYSYLIDRLAGHISMTPEGKMVMTRMRELCRQVFRHTVMTKWGSLPQDGKDLVIETLYREFPVPLPSDAFDRVWMLGRMRSYMSHRRSEARSATKRPDWLERDDWRRIKEEVEKTPERWQQQRDAARARVEAGSVHHLGSGGWAAFRADFFGVTGREPNKVERMLGAQHGMDALIKRLERRGGETPYAEPLRREELDDPDDG